jgi:ceramide glucosyltransferase
MFALVVICISSLLAAELWLRYRQRRAALLRLHERTSRPLATYPSVTVIRPVKGPDVEQEANFRAAVDHRYPGPIETIFVFEDEHDPGYQAARDAIDERVATTGKTDARILLSGRPPAGRTGKIHNMIVAMKHATGELVAFGDSDSRPDQRVLTDLVEHLMHDPGAGAAFAPAMTPSAPRTAGDVGHNLVLNAFLTANTEGELGASRELPFLVGQLMIFRRRVIDAMGGIECAEGQLVDDLFLGAQVVRVGYRNLMGTHPLHIISHGLSLGGFFRLWRRWLLVGRSGIPFSFAAPFVVRATSFFLALALAITAASVGEPLVALAPLALFLIEGLYYVRLNQLVGGAPVPLRYVWMAWMPYLAAVPIGASMLLKPRVSWRGHVYQLSHGALESSPFVPAVAPSGDPRGDLDGR